MTNNLLTWLAVVTNGVAVAIWLYGSWRLRRATRRLNAKSAKLDKLSDRMGTANKACEDLLTEMTSEATCANCGACKHCGGHHEVPEAMLQ